jgi:hypothetical protein
MKRVSMNSNNNNLPLRQSIDKRSVSPMLGTSAATGTGKKL